MLTSWFRVGLVLGALVLAAGCGDDDDNHGGYTAADIQDQTVQGTHDGQPFTLVTASVKEDAFDANELSVKLYGEQVDPCDTFTTPDAGYIMFSVDRAVGEYPLHFSMEGSQTVTFYVPPGSNTIATEGIIVIESLDGSSVTMGILADAGDDNHINGRFTADICP